MIGIVMAGGLGSRMKLNQEKLLLRYKKPVVLHVTDALRSSGCLKRVVAAVSPNSPETAGLLKARGVETVQSPGRGYVQDLGLILKQTDDHVLVVPGDLPLLDGGIVQRIASLYDPDRVWTGILVTRRFADPLGLPGEFTTRHGGSQCYYTGVSLINAHRIDSAEPVRESYEICDDERIAFNLNTAREYEMLQSRKP